MSRPRVLIDADLRDLIPGFLDNRTRELTHLAQALDQGDLERIARIGHNLKGAAASYGFTGLAQLGADLEACARRGDTGRAGSIVTALENYLATVEVVFG